MGLNDKFNCQVSTIFMNPRSIHVETLRKWLNDNFQFFYSKFIGKFEVTSKLWDSFFFYYLSIVWSNIIEIFSTPTPFKEFLLKSQIRHERRKIYVFVSPLESSFQSDQSPRKSSARRIFLRAPSPVKFISFYLFTIKYISERLKMGP
jgi:hypothetical protein